MLSIPQWYFDSLPQEGRGERFRTNDKLRSKVDTEGRFRLFCGETTVFELPEDVKLRLAELQERLYNEAGDMLAHQRLSSEGMHMTLHSLWDMEEDIKLRDAPYSHAQVREALDSIRRDFPHRIMMRSVCPLNMVNTSVVMGLVPASESDARVLMEVCSRISPLYPRSYGLTPHITLAYYRPGEYTEESWRRLKRVFVPEFFDFPIKTESLFFKSFTDMDSYRLIY